MSGNEVALIREQAAEGRALFAPGTPEKYPGAKVSVNLLALEALLADYDHWRGLVEKVGVVDALRGLLAAAEPLCGKPEVRPGRVRLPKEWHPYEAASPSVRVLREAVIAARVVLAAPVRPGEPPESET